MEQLRGLGVSLWGTMFWNTCGLQKKNENSSWGFLPVDSFKDRLLRLRRQWGRLGDVSHDMILELLQIFEHYQIKLFISPGLSLSWRCVQKYWVPVEIIFECITSGQSEPLGIASALRTITVPAPDSPLTSVFQGLLWNLAGLHCQGKFLFPVIYLNSIKFFFNSKTSFRRTCCPVP